MRDSSLEKSKPFFDTNVVVYASVSNDPRSDEARVLLAGGGVISVQILNEFVAVSRRKLKKSWNDISKALAILNKVCPSPLPVTVETHQSAIQIAEKHGYSIYDSLVIAAALQGNCKILYSEDMKHGQKIEGLTIRNPFLAAPG